MKKFLLATVFACWPFSAFAQTMPPVTQVTDAKGLLQALAAKDPLICAVPGSYLAGAIKNATKTVILGVALSSGICLATGPTPAQAWIHGATNSGPGTCPYGGNPYCAGAPAGAGSTSPGAGSGLYQNAAFFTYARQSSQTYSSSHPPTFDVSCVDFACGIPSSVTLTDPESSPPAGCVYSATGSYLGGPGIQCFNLTGNLTINGYDFSLHNCLPLEVKGGTTANNIVITVSNSKFVNGSNCSNSGGVSGASGGLIRYNGTSNYTGNMSLVMENNFLNGVAASFPNELDNLVTFNAPGSGTYTGSYNVWLNAPGRSLGFGPNGGISSAAEYVENFVYPPSLTHGEFIINSWTTRPATQPSARYTYDVCLQGSAQVISGSTTCFYVTPGEAYGTITAAEVDHSIAVTNLNSGSTTTSAALAEFSYVTYTNVTLLDDYVDPTGALENIVVGAPTFTNPPTVTGLVNLVTGAAITGCVSGGNLVAC